MRPSLNHQSQSILERVTEESSQLTQPAISWRDSRSTIPDPEALSSVAYMTNCGYPDMDSRALATRDAELLGIAGLLEGFATLFAERSTTKDNVGERCNQEV